MKHHNLMHLGVMPHRARGLQASPHRKRRQHGAAIEHPSSRFQQTLPFDENAEKIKDRRYRQKRNRVMHKHGMNVYHLVQSLKTQGHTVHRKRLRFSMLMG